MSDATADGSLDLNEHLVAHREATFFIRVHSESMAGAGIHDGDLLVVDRAAPPTAGSLAVVAVGGRFALRRLGRAGDRPETADGAAVELWGVVRWAVHRLWPAREARP